MKLDNTGCCKRKILSNYFCFTLKKEHELLNGTNLGLQYHPVWAVFTGPTAYQYVDQGELASTSDTRLVLPRLPTTKPALGSSCFFKPFFRLLPKLGAYKCIESVHRYGINPSLTS